MSPRNIHTVAQRMSRTAPTAPRQKRDGRKAAVRTARPRFESGIPLPRIDARTLGSRRFRALVRACVAEIGGDTTGLSELDKLAVSQAAALMMQVEEAQATLVAGGRCDPNVLIRASSECRRSLEVLREKAAKNKPAAPSLAEFLAQRAAQSEEEDEA